jgi:hypothetical protein
MKKFIFFFLIILSNAVYAAPQDLNIPLGGGTITPSGELQISFSPLKLNVLYNVTCNINAANTTGMHFRAVGYISVPSASLNGKSISVESNGSNGGINKGDNVFLAEVDNYYSGTSGYLDLLNLDNSISETVSCSATPDLNPGF